MVNSRAALGDILAHFLWAGPGNSERCDEDFSRFEELRDDSAGDFENILTPNLGERGWSVISRDPGLGEGVGPNNSLTRSHSRFRGLGEGGGSETSSDAVVGDTGDLGKSLDAGLREGGCPNISPTPVNDPSHSPSPGLGEGGGSERSSDAVVGDTGGPGKSLNAGLGEGGGPGECWASTSEWRGMSHKSLSPEFGGETGSYSSLTSTLGERGRSDKSLNPGLGEGGGPNESIDSGFGGAGASGKLLTSCFGSSGGLSMSLIFDVGGVSDPKKSIDSNAESGGSLDTSPHAGIEGQYDTGKSFGSRLGAEDLAGISMPSLSIVACGLGDSLRIDLGDAFPEPNEVAGVSC